MNSTKKFGLIILAIILFTGCNFISNTFKYKNTTETFVEALLKEDYDKCIDYMAMDHELARNVNIDTMKAGLASFRQLVIENWGTDLRYSFIKSEKKFSNNEKEKMPPYTTYMLIEFDNGKELGIFQVLFDDKSRKILNIKTLDMKLPVPRMIFFWLFGLLAICIPVFNIYVLRQIKQSNLRRKWLKYIVVILLNVPTIKYGAIDGLSLDVLSVQILFGISFSYGGFVSSCWSFGIPLGGLYWFWKLRQREVEDEEQELIVEQTQHDNLSADPGEVV